MGAYQIAIAEDERLMRLFIGGLLQSAGSRYQTCLEVDSVESLMKALPGVDADILLLDLGFRQKGSSGLDGLPRLHAEFPDLPILVVSRHIGYLSTVKKYVRGYIIKEEVPELLEEAISTILEKKLPFFSESVKNGDQLIAADDDARLLIDRLTQVETEIVRLTARGLSSKEIARMTDRSPRTIEVILSSQIYPKLGLNTSQKNKKVELSRIAIKAGLDGI